MIQLWEVLWTKCLSRKFHLFVCKTANSILKQWCALIRTQVLALQLAVMSNLRFVWPVP